MGKKKNNSSYKTEKLALPEAFLAQMRELLREEDYERFLESYAHPRRAGLRRNPLKTRADGFAEAMPFPMRRLDSPLLGKEDVYVYGESVEGEIREEESTEGYVRQAGSVKEAARGESTQGEAPGKHPYHEAGAYYIQEPSATAVVPMLWGEESADREGLRVLDLCAAPGGKATQLAAAMRGRGLLVANEPHPARAKILSENVERMGVRNCVVLNENPAHLSCIFPVFFDKILVDAPCSGEGMFRKNSDAIGEWSPERVALCADRQREILREAALMCREGGMIVYSTCTFNRTENEENVALFLKEHPQFHLCRILREFPHKTVEITFDEDGGEKERRVCESVGEGHFAALLRRRAPRKRCGANPKALGDLSSGTEPKALGNISCGERGNKEYHAKDRRARAELAEAIEAFENFAKETLTGETLAEIKNSSYRYELFGKQLYLTPTEMLPLDGLRVLRPGLALGEKRKGRWLPNHALALALRESEVLKSIVISEKDAARYIHGETLTFPSEENEGWLLLCTGEKGQTFSLGWGKLVNGSIKNHYPKGLRK